MLKEIFNKSKIFKVFHEEVRGVWQVALGHPVDNKDWLAFIKMVLLREKQSDCYFMRQYMIQNEQLVTAWVIYSKNPDILDKYVCETISKPEWLKNYSIEVSQSGIKASLIGDPIYPPDPGIVLGVFTSRRM